MCLGANGLTKLREDALDHVHPAPQLTRVRFADVYASLPADTPRVTPEQRRCQIAGRQIHVARRELA